MFTQRPEPIFRDVEGALAIMFVACLLLLGLLTGAEFGGWAGAGIGLLVTGFIDLMIMGSLFLKNWLADQRTRAWYREQGVELTPFMKVPVPRPEDNNRE